MQAPFQKPENALKRADELQAINQPEAALMVLHNAIGHRRFKAAGWDSIQEKILLRYVQLCVDLEKLRLAREGLHLYRSISQQANVASLGKVICELRDRSEKRMSEAKSLVAEDELKQTLLGKDLETAETPEEIMLSTLHSDVRRTSGQKVHAALRFGWETYKMILDVLRMTPKLERVYHDTAQKAFQFCRENERSQEFKRFCEVLRNHYALLQKHKHKAENEALLRADLHLETRLVQLSAAADLNLWREACNTAEDIYSLGIHDLLHLSFRSNTEIFPKAREKLLKWLAVYYDKITQILWVSDNYLFHALGMLRYFLHLRKFKKNLSKSEMTNLCTRAVLAVLSIPVATERETKDDGVTEAGTLTVENQKKLTSMLGHPAIPNREFLKNALSYKGILGTSSPACQQLYSILENEFTPLKLCQLCIPLLEELEKESTDIAQYIGPIKIVVFHKLILQISKVYSSICVEHFTQKICPPEFLPWSEAEKVIVNLVHMGFVHVGLDYSQNALSFGGGSSDTTLELRRQLTNMAVRLDTIVGHMDLPVDKPTRIIYDDDFRDQLRIEHLNIKQRNLENEIKRQEKQAEQHKAEETRKKLLEQQRLLEERQEQRRRDEALKRREETRLKEEKYRVKSETAQSMLEEIKKLGGCKFLIKGKGIDQIHVSDVLDGNVVFEDIERAQEEQRTREKLERIRLRKAEAKRVDHFIRARSEEEMHLFEEWKNLTKRNDTNLLQELQSKHLEEHKRAFDESISEKQALQHCKAFKSLFLEDRMKKREEEHEENLKKQKQRLTTMLKKEKIQRAKDRLANEKQARNRAEKEVDEDAESEHSD